MSEPRTVAQLIRVGERVLGHSTAIFDDHDVELESRELMGHLLGLDDDELPEAMEPPRRLRERYLSLIARRAAGEPLPFLLGHIVFYGLDLKVKPGAFVPRPSSELTVTRAAKRLRRKQHPVVVDVCTGTGPIALAIGDEFPHAEVWGTDIAGDALLQGRDNARRLGIDNVTFRRGDMYGALPKRLRSSVDVITGHVPYVAPGELDDLPSEVREFEPLYTLTDHSLDGLGLMRAAVEGADEWLKPGGWLLLETADDLAAKVRRMCRKAGFEDHGMADDEDGLSIVVEARRP